MTDIDSIDATILRELEHDGRITNVDLAGRVGLSPSACLRRVQELERAGVITGYRAVLDPAAMGRGFVAFVTIGLGDHSLESQHGFEDAVRESAAVRECHNIAGEKEYLLRVEVRGLAEYKAFHEQTLGGLPQIASITTHVVMASPKDATHS